MTIPTNTVAPPGRVPGHDRIAVGLLAGIVLILFAGPLFFQDGTIVSNIKGDTAQNHVYLRGFGISELAKGNLPLWNPYLFSGTPFLGSMQAAPLYPSTLLYFFLPIDKAINFDMALHLFLMGAFTYAWLRNARISPMAATYGAVVAMLSGATFLRILAGQINVIASLCWAPLLFLAIDRIVASASVKRFPSGWCLVGIVATSMIVMAGYPQTLFIAAFCCAVYTLLRLPGAARPGAALLELGTLAVLPVGLTAIQLWTGIASGLESVRGGAITYEFASSYSLPPENVVTLFTPAFFGDIVRTPAWGRWGFWDDSLYAGIVTLPFLVAAALRWRSPFVRLSFVLVLLTLALALGRYTPVHKVFFDFVPGFDKFRAPSKFLPYTILFVAALAATGLDALRDSPKGRTWLGGGTAILGALLLGAAGFIALNDAGTETSLWWRLLAQFKSTPDTYVWMAVTPELVADTSWLARTNLILAGSASLAGGILLARVRRPHWSLRATAALGMIELVVFAAAYRDTFTLQDLARPGINEALALVEDKQRVHYVVDFEDHVNNHILGQGGYAVWGYDPLILQRYGDLMSTLPAGPVHQEVLRDHIYTWGSDPFGRAIQFGFSDFTTDRFPASSALLEMLRCRALIVPPLPAQYASLVNFLRSTPAHSPATDDNDPETNVRLVLFTNTMPRFALLSNYDIASTSDDALAALHDPGFDPRTTVVLESPPIPAPAAELRHGTVEVLDQSTDHATLRVELSDPAILLVTDSYAEGWRATPVGDAPQERYDVLPANYALRGIPLTAGTHTFRMDYAPAAYRYGRLATLFSFGIFLGLVALWVVNRYEHGPVRKHKNIAAGPPD